MSNQYTKISPCGSGKIKTFIVSVRHSALPEILKEESCPMYQPITENALRILRGYTMTNQANFNNIIRLNTEKEAIKLAKEVNDILNDDNHNLF